jgi:membrane protease YdiL (CAAX protease family)
MSKINKIFLMIIKIFYYFIIYILLLLSFLPILRYYIIPIAIFFILVELIRINKLNQFIYWLLRKKEKKWDVRDSKILSLVFFSLIINLFLFILIWFIMNFFYLIPLKREFTELLKISI